MELLARKVAALRAHHALNARPEAVVDPQFAPGQSFFDPRDLVQVRYEMLRRVRVDGYSVAQAARDFGFSRFSFYAARDNWERGGLPGLVPLRPGPHGGHKLTGQVLAFVEGEMARHPRGADLATLIQQRFGLVVHPRSVERALARRNLPALAEGEHMLDGRGPRLSAAYETMREWARAEWTGATRPPGVALLISRGLPEWLMAASCWLSSTAPGEPCRTPLGTSTRIVPPGEAVVILSNMILSLKGVQI